MSKGLDAALAARGFNLTGSLPREIYDSIAPAAWQSLEVAPETRSTLIAGHAGRSIWEHFRASPEAQLRRDPFDRFARRVFEELCAEFPSVLDFAPYTAKRRGAYLPLVRLGQRAGFGAPGRLGVLIHPEFGPWVAMRAVFFLRDEVEYTEPPHYDPCPACLAPCVAACHGGAMSGQVVDFEACTRTKLEHPRCRVGCDARRACVVGPEHAYGDAQMSHHSALRLISPWG